MIKMLFWTGTVSIGFHCLMLFVMAVKIIFSGKQSAVEKGEIVGALVKEHLGRLGAMVLLVAIAAKILF